MKGRCREEHTLEPIERAVRVETIARVTDALLPWSTRGKECSVAVLYLNRAQLAYDPHQRIYTKIDR